MAGQVLPNTLAFGRLLRGLGLDAGPDRMIDLARAAEEVGLARRSDFAHAARALCVRRREEIARFDRAFEAFWRKPAEGETTLDLAAMGEKRRFRRPAFEAGTEGAAADPPSPTAARPYLRIARTWSAAEVLRHKDFAEMTESEAADVRGVVARLAWRLPPRRTRRSRAGDGRAMDLRRTLRGSLRHGGEVLAWSRRERARKPRPLVVIADISGSMETYTRTILLFLYALSRALPARVETFLFGTRLTRVTRGFAAAARDPDAALAAAARAVPDWSGGTRIGDVLREFNRHWTRRVLGQGAAVLVVSDGWDRGDPARLGFEMARLQRSCHRLIWLNPLLGQADYAPLARGIQAALPYIDDFLPGNDLASLEGLARRLAEVPPRRTVRRRAPVLLPETETASA